MSHGGGEVDLQNIEFLKREIDNLTVEKEMYKSQSEKNYAELNKKNQELVIRIEELNNLKLQYQ